MIEQVLGGRLILYPIASTLVRQKGGVKSAFTARSRHIGNQSRHSPLLSVPLLKPHKRGYLEI